MESIFNNLPDEQRGEKKLMEKAIVNQYIQDAQNNELLDKNHIAVVNSYRYNFFKSISLIFLLAIIGIAAYYVYLVQNGSLQSTVEQVCGSITCQTCPEIPAINNSCENVCQLTCSQNFTCPDCICGNSTW